MSRMRSYVRFLLAFLLFASFAPLAAPAVARAQADDACGSGTSLSHSFFDVVDNGDDFSDTAYTEFRFTRQELEAIRCAPAVAVEFRMSGYETREGETYYDFFSDTLPPGNEYLWVEGVEAVMGIEIDTHDLDARLDYVLELDFGGFFPVRKGEIPHEMTAHLVLVDSYSQYDGECDAGDTEVITDQGSFCRYVFGEPIQLDDPYDFEY